MWCFLFFFSGIRKIKAKSWKWCRFLEDFQFEVFCRKCIGLTVLVSQRVEHHHNLQSNLNSSSMESSMALWNFFFQIHITNHIFLIFDNESLQFCFRNCFFLFWGIFQPQKFFWEVQFSNCAWHYIQSTNILNHNNAKIVFTQ